MSKATRDITKKKRPQQTGTPVMVRMQPDQLEAVDAWASAQDDAPSRPEAVRRLVDQGLKELTTGRN